MKKIVTTTSVFEPCTDMARIIRRLAAVGFDAVDIAFDYCVQNADFPFMTARASDWAKEMRETAESLGIAITHAHAPFDVSARGEMVERTFKCAELMGVKYIVSHPVWKSAPDRIITDIDEFIEVNAEAVAPMLEAAQKHGLVLLSENLLWGASIPPANISKLVRAVGHPHFGWCFDTGHAHAFGHEADELCLPDCEVVPLSLHMQDTDGKGHDNHSIPGDGTIDWTAFAAAMKRIGYKGDAVLEAHHQSLEMPDSERDAFFGVMLERTKRIRDMME